jgi:cell wall assembly regulator SMI1
MVVDLDVPTCSNTAARHAALSRFCGVESIMRRTYIVLLSILFVFVGTCVALWCMRDRLIVSLLSQISPRETMYPAAPPMPAPVSTPMSELLARYDAFLRDKAPRVYAELQPGLTDSDIDQLEQKYNLKLTADLRALYRWRNGSKRNSMLAIFPDANQLIPLDVALNNRDIMRREIEAPDGVPQALNRVFLGQRGSWVGVIEDFMGDGYFFDPRRTEAQGSFFYCSKELGYVFYPRFANYLAAVVQGQKAGVYRAGPRGIETSDFEKAIRLMRRYGATPDQ